MVAPEHEPAQDSGAAFLRVIDAGNRGAYRPVARIPGRADDRIADMPVGSSEVVGINTSRGSDAAFAARDLRAPVARQSVTEAAPHDLRRGNRCVADFRGVGDLVPFAMLLLSLPLGMDCGLSIQPGTTNAVALISAPAPPVAATRSLQNVHRRRSATDRQLSAGRGGINVPRQAPVRRHTLAVGRRR